MTTLWLAIAGAALLNVAIKASGPALLGELQLPARVRAVLALLAPALFAALVAVALFSDGQRLALNDTAAGVAITAVGVLARPPFLLAVAVGAATTAVLRAAT